ncbi:hypothetical protein [Nonomuraea sp. NPDC049646]|uniref:hypothetical protein n=1 Tax=unclassified Nonomuraea TaxID=2593643 RepID=UPI0037ACA048
MRRVVLVVIVCGMVVAGGGVLVSFGWPLIYRWQHEETTAQAEKETRRLADGFADDLRTLLTRRWPTDQQVRELGNEYEMRVSHVTSRRPSITVEIETITTVRESFGGGLFRACFHVEATEAGGGVRTSVTPGGGCSR